MFYLSAHVVTTHEGARAINALLHDENNELMGAMCDVRPGRNQVLSYLDVWFPGPIRYEEIKNSLIAAKDHLHRADTELPLSLTTSGIKVEFGCTIGVFEGDQYGNDFAALEERALALVKEPRHWSAVVPRAALQVNVIQKDDTVTYALTEESKRRLFEVHGKNWFAKRIIADQFGLMDLEALQGNIKPDLVQTMTDIPLSDISRFGGIKFVDTATQKIIWRYP
jgi:hypothetical protein